MKAYIQRLGRALMLPVACLPAAALFLGIGYWIDPSGWGGSNVVAAYLCKTGGAILDNLGLLFAVGVAIGMARDKDGASALSALVGFLTVTTIMGSASMFLGFDATKVDTEHPAFAAGAIGNKNVFFGILVGCVAGALYNKFGKTKLPDFLAFFSGRRCVPILTAAVMSIISLLLLFIWPAVYGALVWFGESIMGLGAVGAGIYAFFNRLLIPTGLHHALNNVFWFNLANINDIGKFWGSADPASGAVIATGGFHPFGVYVTGIYQAGFFPIMMFGLPAGALAIYKNAKPENKKATGSRCHRAAGVLLHVRRLPAVRGARAAHRHLGVHRRFVPVDRRLQLLRRLHRLVPVAEGSRSSYAVDAYRSGPRLRGHLLLRVRLHDQEVQHEDPGPWR